MARDSSPFLRGVGRIKREYRNDLSRVSYLGFSNHGRTLVEYRVEVAVSHANGTTDENEASGRKYRHNEPIFLPCEILATFSSSLQSLFLH